MKKSEKNLTEKQILEDEKILQDHTAPTKEEIENQLRIAKKRVKKISRNHKLYVRATNGSLRRLDKISQDVYGRIILLFLKGDGEKRYAKLNADVKNWQDLKPIQMPLEIEDAKQFALIQKALRSKAKEIVVSYNSSWKPLVNIYMYLPKVELTEKKQ